MLAKRTLKVKSFECGLKCSQLHLASRIGANWRKKSLGKNEDTHALKSSYRCFCVIMVVRVDCNIREGRDTCHKDKLTNKPKAPFAQSRSFKEL